MEATKYVAYTRVSTKEQGLSKLGLAAQLELISHHIKRVGGTLTSTFTDVVSGKSPSKKQLCQALAACSDGSTLIVSSLDRLGRDVKQLFAIRDSIKNIAVVDNPNVKDILIFSIYASMAQKERELISTRTKAALNQYKEQCKTDPTKKPLGGFRGSVEKQRVAGLEIGKRAKEDAANHPANMQARNIIHGLLQRGFSMFLISRELNFNKVLTITGKQFSIGSVARIMKMYDLHKKLGCNAKADALSETLG